MKLLESKRKIRLPEIFYITKKEDVAKLPIGVPYIFGNPDDEPYIVMLLEYQVLWQSAKKSGFSFNWARILKDQGFDVTKFGHSTVEKFICLKSSEDWDKTVSLDDFKHGKKPLEQGDLSVEKFLSDASCYVDISKLHELKIIPTWVSHNIEEAIKINITNFLSVNPYMYNKKLDGAYGDVVLESPPRNLFIIDISGSIPRGASATTLSVARTLSESFYADILITGSKSTLYTYEEVHNLDIDTIYDENGMDNDQAYFKKLVSEEYRVYNTLIVFGDEHNPGYDWSNKYNHDTRKITIHDGKKLCKWKVDNIICFHTDYNNRIPGYATWFDVPESNVTFVKNWIKYL